MRQWLYRRTVPELGEPVIRRATSRDLSALAGLRCEFTLEDGPIAAPREDFDFAFIEIVGRGLSDGRWVVCLPM